MSDPDLVRKKLASIETYLRELREFGGVEAMETDIRQRRFVEHTLQIMIQATLDVASHIVSSERYGEPRTNHELFVLLERNGWLEPDEASALRKMTGFRNILVHGYAEVDTSVVRDVMDNRLGDIEAFVAAVRRRMG